MFSVLHTSARQRALWTGALSKLVLLFLERENIINPFDNVQALFEREGKQSLGEHLPINRVKLKALPAMMITEVISLGFQATELA